MVPNRAKHHRITTIQIIKEIGQRLKKKYLARLIQPPSFLSYLVKYLKRLPQIGLKVT